MRNEDENVKHVSELFFLCSLFLARVSLCDLSRCKGEENRKYGNSRKKNYQTFVEEKVEMFFGGKVARAAGGAKVRILIRKCWGSCRIFFGILRRVK